MPLLSVIKANKTDRNSVEAPAEKVKKINQTQTKAGISVTLRKVELASGETRAFLAVKNRSGGQISFYSFNSVILQGSSQFKEETQYGLDDDLTIDSEIENGVTDKGAVYFKEIKSNKPFEIRFEFSDSNYNTQTFSFSVR